MRRERTEDVAFFVFIILKIEIRGGEGGVFVFTTFWYTGILVSRWRVYMFVALTRCL